MNDLDISSYLEDEKITDSLVRDLFMDNSMRRRDGQRSFTICTWKETWRLLFWNWYKRSVLDMLRYKSRIAEIEHSKAYQTLIRACEKYHLKYRTEIQKNGKNADRRFEYTVSVSYDSASLSDEQRIADNLRMQHEQEQILHEIEELEQKHENILKSIANALWKKLREASEERISAATLQSDLSLEIRRQFFQYSVSQGSVDLQALRFYEKGKADISFCAHPLISFGEFDMPALPEEKIVPFTYALGRKLHDEILDYYDSIGAETNAQVQVADSDLYTTEVFVEVKNPFYKSPQIW